LGLKIASIFVEISSDIILGQINLNLVLTGRDHFGQHQEILSKKSQAI